MHGREVREVREVMKVEGERTQISVCKSREGFIALDLTLAPLEPHGASISTYSRTAREKDFWRG